MDDSMAKIDNIQIDKLEGSSELKHIILPEKWIYLPLPTFNKKDFGVYFNSESMVMSLTCPFEYAQLASMYRHFFNEPLLKTAKELGYNSTEVKKKIEEAIKSKIELDKKTRKKTSNKLNQKMPPAEERLTLMQNAKRKNCEPQQSYDGPAKMQKTHEEVPPDKVEGGDLLAYCQSVSLKDFKVNTNDPISLLTQLCECVLKFRPEYEFEACGTQHRCIVKILKLNHQNQEIASNKKKAKFEACVQTLKIVFPKAYSNWICLTTQNREIAQNEDREFEEEEKKFSGSLIQQVKKNDQNDQAPMPCNESNIPEKSQNYEQSKTCKKDSTLEYNQASKQNQAFVTKQSLIKSETFVQKQNPSNLQNLGQNQNLVQSNLTESIDYSKIEIEDPNLLNYSPLLTSYNPMSLLQKYSKTIRRSNIKYERTNSETTGHQCKVRFYSKHRIIEAVGVHSTNALNATFYACQRMLKILNPNIFSWSELVSVIDKMPEAREVGMMRAIVQPIIYDFSEKSESPSPPKRKRLFKPEEFKDIIRESESEEQGFYKFDPSSSDKWGRFPKCSLTFI